ncbi:hypothetical protein BGW38_010848 [Lunasporangiospora selenospora]|uniref:Uncharacterized protein n=1 Tax=Lunasporangiospora selenospora TaxID=979761 RepID=A0A9P6KIG4_9FUNG|nr:hypothetical protein BGW38_010848 [Lunasporangiospora selenospora]
MTTISSDLPQQQQQQQQQQHGTTASEVVVAKQARYTTSSQQERFSLGTWIRNAPWSQYFRDGCRWIIKSPLNFIIFFLCVNVVVWGAFLVLLLGNLVKLKDDPTQKLWIEIASQVLNGIFTLANVPVNPKRFAGFIRGCRTWKEDNVIRKQFVNRYLEDHKKRELSNLDRPGSERTDADYQQELLQMLDFYRCFPEFGRERAQGPAEGDNYSKDMIIPFQSSPFVERSKSAIRATATPIEPGLVESNRQDTSIAIDSGGCEAPIETGAPEQGASIKDSSNQTGFHVSIAEEDLDTLRTEETHRVVQSAVLPFLPFSPTISDRSEDASPRLGTSVAMQSIGPTAALARDVTISNLNPGQQPEIPRIAALQRGSSIESIHSLSGGRGPRRTRSRTMSMSKVEGRGPSGLDRRHTFTILEETTLEHRGVEDDLHHNSTSEDDNENPLTPMPLALTLEQVDWIDNRQVKMLGIQARIKKSWPWYNSTFPQGIEPVDFYASPQDVERHLARSNQRTDASTALLRQSSESTIWLKSRPEKLLISPPRFCLMMGSFNINSFVQEILCGLMWGISYHVRPGWIVGTGMAVGCLAAIIPSVMIVIHENRMSRVRMIATTEGAIQDALDDSKAAMVNKPQ